MDTHVLKTGALSGTIKVPGSKSQAIRALFIASLAKGTSKIEDLTYSDDVNTAIKVIESLGVKIKKTKVENGSFNVTVESNGAPFNAKNKIFTGNSGVTTRFLLPLLGLRKKSQQKVTINCGKQMQNRPIVPFLKNLKELGLKINTNGKKIWPIEISGDLIGGQTQVDGLTSQYISALLIAGPYAKKDITLNVENLNELAYVEMTLKWLTEQGVICEYKATKSKHKFTIKCGQNYKKIAYKIPGDFSSASALITAGCLVPGQIILEGLKKDDLQEDKKLIEILQKMGAKIDFKNNKIIICGAQPLKGTTIDANNMPDLLPVLAVIGTFAHGKTIIKNVPQARYKETDRIHSMVEGLKAMGAKIKELKDGIIVQKSDLHGAKINSYADHRTIMAITVAGMIASGETCITDTEGLNKTYPQFLSHIKILGANLQNHIVIIGFKHTGKTIFGKFLAKKLNKKFIDLDDKVVETYERQNNQKLSCREILAQKGEKYFRDLESRVLKELVSQKEHCILALGGGTLTRKSNQKAIARQMIIHVTAPKNIVFERIMIHGKPAFFDNEEDDFETFKKIWDKRTKTFEALAGITIQSDGSADFKNMNDADLNMVIGYPLEHTLSPIFHNEEYKKQKINAVMVASPNQNIGMLVTAIRILKVKLTAVTIPHKESIIPLLDVIDPIAKKIGAVNTVIQKDGKLYGFNTDYYGVKSALKGIILRDKNVLILGAGGAAKPTAQYLEDQKAHIYCINRNKQRAVSLTGKFGGETIDINDLESLKIDVIINTTPIGMYPNVNESPLPEKYLKSHQIVLDFVYNPKDTLLTKQAKQKGAKIIYGTSIFKAQALEQIKLLKTN